MRTCCTRLGYAKPERQGDSINPAEQVAQVKIVGFPALARDPDFKDKLLATKNFDVVLSKFDRLDRLVKAVKALLPGGLIRD